MALHNLFVGKSISPMLSIRLARPDEYAEIGELTYKSYLPLFSDRDNFNEKEFSASDYARDMRDVEARAKAAECIAVAMVDGKMVGCVDYHSNYAKQGQPGFGKLAVDPTIRKGGIGLGLVKWCIERARTQGAPTLLLHTTELMPAAMRMYRRLGWVRLPSIDFQANILVMGFVLTLDTPSKL